MKSIHILPRINALNHPVYGNVGRQRQLYNKSMQFRVGIQAVDFGKQLCFCDVFLKANEAGAKANLTACFHFRSHIGFAGSAVAHQNGCQVRRNSGLFRKSGRFNGQFFLKAQGS